MHTLRRLLHAPNDVARRARTHDACSLHCSPPPRRETTHATWPDSTWRPYCSARAHGFKTERTYGILIHHCGAIHSHGLVSETVRVQWLSAKISLQNSTSDAYGRQDRMTRAPRANQRRLVAPQPSRCLRVCNLLGQMLSELPRRQHPAAEEMEDESRFLLQDESHLFHRRPQCRLQRCCLQRAKRSMLLASR